MCEKELRGKKDPCLLGNHNFCSDWEMRLGERRRRERVDGGMCTFPQHPLDAIILGIEQKEASVYAMREETKFHSFEFFSFESSFASPVPDDKGIEDFRSSLVFNIECIS